MPAIILNHKPQVSRDNIVQLLKPITHVFVKVFIPKVHDLNRECATQSSQARNDRQKLSSLVIPCSKNNAATAVVEACV
jgi:hypothetical protein